MAKTSRSECYVCGATKDVLRRHYQRSLDRHIYGIPVCVGCANSLYLGDAPVQVSVREPERASLPLPGSDGISW